MQSEKNSKEAQGVGTAQEQMLVKINEEKPTAIAVIDALPVETDQLKASIYYLKTVLDHLELCSERMYFYKKEYEELRDRYVVPKKGIVKPMMQIVKN